MPPSTRRHCAAANEGDSDERVRFSAAELDRPFSRSCLTRTPPSRGVIAFAGALDHDRAGQTA
jgi:hypothetical protein